jgi:hypothetical protein
VIYEKPWETLEYSVKKDTLRYLALMKKVCDGVEHVSLDEKKWLLANCDLPTYAVPESVLDDKSLWLD